jgi:hypothetical protein
MGLRLEFVAETVHGEDPTWFRGIILQLLAKMPDVNVNRTITTDITGVTPVWWTVEGYLNQAA